MSWCQCPLFTPAHMCAHSASPILRAECHRLLLCGLALHTRQPPAHISGRKARPIPGDRGFELAPTHGTGAATLAGSSPELVAARRGRGRRCGPSQGDSVVGGRVGRLAFRGPRAASPHPHTPRRRGGSPCSGLGGGRRLGFGGCGKTVHGECGPRTGVGPVDRWRTGGGPVGDRWRPFETRQSELRALLGNVESCVMQARGGTFEVRSHGY